MRQESLRIQNSLQGDPLELTHETVFFQA